MCAYRSYAMRPACARWSTGCERDQHTIDSLIIFYVNYDLWAIYTQIHNGFHFFSSVDSISVSLSHTHTHTHGWFLCVFYIWATYFTFIGFYFCFMDSPHQNWLQWEIILDKKHTHNNLYTTGMRRSHDWWNWLKIRRVAETKINKLTSRRNRDCN